MNPDTPVTGIRIREAGAADLAAIADVHLAAFPGFFLTRMGAPFLRAYYRLVAGYELGALLVAEREGRVVGFVVTFLDPAGFYAHMQRERRRLWGPAVAAVLRRPGLVPRLLSNRRRVGAYATGGAGAGRGICELSSIGVDPAAGGQGIGRLLMDAARARAVRDGAVAITLTTDADGNDAVNRFYLKAGYEKTETFDSGQGRMMNRYRIGLDQDG